MRHFFSGITLPLSIPFKRVKNFLGEAFDNLIPFYTTNHLRRNPDKTKLCSFHLRNWEAIRQLHASWYGKNLQHVRYPVHLGITLNVIQKTSSTPKQRWSPGTAYSKSSQILDRGADAKTVCTTALALSFSAAEYLPCLVSIGSRPEVRPSSE